MQIKKNGGKKITGCWKGVGGLGTHNFTQKKQKYCFFLFRADNLHCGYSKKHKQRVTWQVIKYNAY